MKKPSTTRPKTVLEGLFHELVSHLGESMQIMPDATSGSMIIQTKATKIAPGLKVAVSIKEQPNPYNHRMQSEDTFRRVNTVTISETSDWRPQRN